MTSTRFSIGLAAALLAAALDAPVVLAQGNPPGSSESTLMPNDHTMGQEKMDHGPMMDRSQTKRMMDDCHSMMEDMRPHPDDPQAEHG